eukprot:g48093.t1
MASGPTAVANAFEQAPTVMSGSPKPEGTGLKVKGERFKRDPRGNFSMQRVSTFDDVVGQVEEEMEAYKDEDVLVDDCQDEILAVE